jgi:hypothetical protein
MRETNELSVNNEKLEFSLNCAQSREREREKERERERTIERARNSRTRSWIETVEVMMNENQTKKNGFTSMQRIRKYSVKSIFGLLMTTLSRTGLTSSFG